MKFVDTRFYLTNLTMKLMAQRNLKHKAMSVKALTSLPTWDNIHCRKFSEWPYAEEICPTMAAIWKFFFAHCNMEMHPYSERWVFFQWCKSVLKVGSNWYCYNGNQAVYDFTVGYLTHYKRAVKVTIRYSKGYVAQNYGSLGSTLYWHLIQT